MVAGHTRRPPSEQTPGPPALRQSTHMQKSSAEAGGKAGRPGGQAPPGAPGLGRHRLLHQLRHPASCPPPTVVCAVWTVPPIAHIVAGRRLINKAVASCCRQPHQHAEQRCSYERGPGAALHTAFCKEKRPHASMAGACVRWCACVAASWKWAPFSPPAVVTLGAAQAPGGRQLPNPASLRSSGVQELNWASLACRSRQDEL